MKIFVNDELYYNEVKNFLKAYSVFEPIEKVDEIGNSELGVTVCDKHIGVQLICDSQVYKKQYDEVYLNQLFENMSRDDIRKKTKICIKQLMYDVILAGKEMRLPWGILTGIRPTKIAYDLINKYKDAVIVKQQLSHWYRISEEKENLLIDVVKRELPIVQAVKENDIHLYIGIPFCPSKCLYCSFTSYDINHYQHRVNEYLQSIQKELEFFSNHILNKRRLRTIYIGGGTPTSLDEKALEQLMMMIHQNIKIDEIEEFTVEAGRPDTITKEKLMILKKYKVDRISINPQSMNQKTLDLIGRNHRVEEVVNTYKMAKEIGIKTINMDLILGLTDETVEDVKYTLDRIGELDPENITVHTLAIKRHSRLNEHLEDYVLTGENIIEEMLKITSEKMMILKQQPYYLYRQKHMLGNFENVGYSKKGYECIYNIDIIEENTTIYAIGAGTVTKVVKDSNDNSHMKGKKIQRIESVKNVDQYIERIDEMIKRKKDKFI